jgi:predicted aldo/keto reductase-like oxidoreductase
LRLIKTETKMKRRTFLQAVGSITGGLALGSRSLVGAEKTGDELPRRVLGRTGEKISVVGFPGLALIHHDQKECDKGIRTAFERGVNYFDVAPAYGKGVCETRLGRGLQGLDRSRYFLACKTKIRDHDGARQQLEQSLKLLRTDYFDLYQLHHLVRVEDVKQALGPGGALEAILKAKEQGKVKYLGFSAHTTKAALAALRGFRFDTVMFPINFVEYYLRGFGKEVLALSEQQGAAVLAIKAMSWGAWPKDVKRTRNWWYRSVEDAKEVSLALRFTLSQKGVAAGFPPSFLDLLDKAIKAAQSYRPPTEAELKELEKMARSSESIFVKEEAQAHLGQRHGPVFPDCPHACG